MLRQRLGHCGVVVCELFAVLLGVVCVRAFAACPNEIPRTVMCKLELKSCKADQSDCNPNPPPPPANPTKWGEASYPGLFGCQDSGSAKK